MTTNSFLLAGGIAVVLGMLRMLQSRLRLSRAKHRSLRGHARLSRASSAPFLKCRLRLRERKMTRSLQLSIRPHLARSEFHCPAVVVRTAARTGRDRFRAPGRGIPRDTRAPLPERRGRRRSARRSARVLESQSVLIRCQAAGASAGFSASTWIVSSCQFSICKVPSADSASAVRCSTQSPSLA